MAGHAQVRPIVMHGTWSLHDASLRLTPFHPLPAADQAAVELEAGRLLPFVDGGGVSCGSPIAPRSS